MEDNDRSEFPEYQARDAGEIARRALTLFAVVAIACGAPKQDTLAWLQGEALWDELTPEELSFVRAETPARQQKINASWRSEALVVLLWALGKIDRMPDSNSQCDIARLQEVLPPFMAGRAAGFLVSAARRPDDVLERMASDVMREHWRVRDARIHGRDVPPDLNAGVIQERHHAINWVIGYGGAPWDEVATDT